MEESTLLFYYNIRGFFVLQMTWQLFDCHKFFTDFTISKAVYACLEQNNLYNRFFPFKCLVMIVMM